MQIDGAVGYAVVGGVGLAVVGAADGGVGDNVYYMKQVHKND